jgi:hypothetical protein
VANDAPNVPTALLELEQLRIRSELHFSARRALNDRRRALRDPRKEIEQQMQIETSSFSGRQSTIDQGRPTGEGLDLHLENRLIELRRYPSVIDAVDAVVAAAINETERTGGDVAVFKSAEAHLQTTLADWGLTIRRYS